MHSWVSHEARGFVREHVEIVRPAADEPQYYRVPIEDAAAATSSTEPASEDDWYGAEYHVDDFNDVAVDVGDEALLHRAAVITDCHLHAFGFESEDRPHPINIKKLEETKGWVTQARVMGVQLDTVTMLLTLPPDKLQKLNDLIFEQYPRSALWSTVREVQSLIGNLRYLALAVRPGRYFLYQLQAALRKWPALFCTRDV